MAMLEPWAAKAWAIWAPRPLLVLGVSDFGGFLVFGLFVRVEAS